MAKKRRSGAVVTVLRHGGKLLLTRCSTLPRVRHTYAQVPGIASVGGRTRSLGGLRPFDRRTGRSPGGRRSVRRRRAARTCATRGVRRARPQRGVRRIRCRHLVFRARPAPVVSPQKGVDGVARRDGSRRGARRGRGPSHPAQSRDNGGHSYVSRTDGAGHHSVVHRARDKPPAGAATTTAAARRDLGAAHRTAPGRDGTAAGPTPAVHPAA